LARFKRLASLATLYNFGFPPYFGLGFVFCFFSVFLGLYGVLGLEQLWELVGYFPHQLLIGGTALGLLAEDAREDLHEIVLAVLVLLVIRVAQDASAQLQVAGSRL